MLSFITSLLPTSYLLPGWLTLETNPLDDLLQGELFVHSFSQNCTYELCYRQFLGCNTNDMLSDMQGWSVHVGSLCYAP